MAHSNRPWQTFEGHTFNGRYTLGAPLQSSEQDAIFLTEYGADRLPATIRFVAAGTMDAALYLSGWRKAASLSHPSLLSVYDYGEGMLDDAPVVFVVTAYPEDRLADVLSDRALTEDETHDVAGAVVEALVYLHEQDLVLGNLDPAHVFAVDDQVKISSCHIQSGRLAVEDIERFGLFIVQCLTQQRPDTASFRISGIPPRFRKIVENSLQAEPSERWTAVRIRSILREESEPEPESKHPTANKGLGYATIAAALVVLIGGGVYLTGSKNAEPPQPSAATVPATTQATTQATTPAKALVQPQSAKPVGERQRVTPVRPAGGNQFVIIATYNRLADAEKRAKSITTRWPKFPAEVHTPNRHSPPYLVTIGANLSKPEAAQLQRRARAAGLPRDTYFQSF
jgi:hypothetical protein